MRPNILVTGTPGVGKSRLCKQISDKFNYNHVDVSALAKQENFILNHDDEFECPVIDEEALLDHMESVMESGGNIVEYHSSELFPERFFQAVYVVTCDNTILYDRLIDRGYNPKKLQSNIECEIFQECLNEANNSYDNSIVTVLIGESETDLDASVNAIATFLERVQK